MSLRNRLKTSVSRVLNKFSGEYSAAESEIRQPAPDESPTAAAAGGEVKVTRARLKRPPGEPES